MSSGEDESLSDAPNGRLDKSRELIRKASPWSIVDEYPLTSSLALVAAGIYVSTGSPVENFLTSASVLYSALIFLADAYLPQSVLSFFSEHPLLWAGFLLLIGGTFYSARANGWGSVWSGVNTVWNEFSQIGRFLLSKFVTTLSRVGGAIRNSGILSDIFSATFARVIVLVLIGLGVVSAIVKLIQGAF